MPKSVESFLIDPHFERILHNLIEGVRPGTSPQLFVSLVSQAFKRKQNELPRSDMDALLRRSKGHSMLRNTLRSIQTRRARPARILVLGCGPTYAGVSAEYTESVAREAFEPGDIELLRSIDLTPEELGSHPSGTYDLVLTHSLAHFIPNLAQFFHYVTEAVATGGYFVLGREPNRNFWENQTIQKTVSDLKKRSRSSVQQTLLSPRKLMAWLKAGVRGAPAVQVHEAVNQVLQNELGFKRPLTSVEIAKLVDPHLPSDFPGNFSIGFEGMDWKVLQARYLPAFVEREVETWQHLGRSNEAGQPSPALEEELAAKYPGDGCFFTVVWQKE